MKLIVEEWRQGHDQTSVCRGQEINLSFRLKTLGCDLGHILGYVVASYNEQDCRLEYEIRCY